jgi:hypothetical protein
VQQCPVNGQKVLVVPVYVSQNTPSDDWKSSIFSNMAGYSPKLCKMFEFLARRSCEDMPIILAGAFNVNVKGNYNAELVDFMKDTFELDFLSDLSQGTTRSKLASIWCLDKIWTICPKTISKQELDLVVP